MIGFENTDYIYYIFHFVFYLLLTYLITKYTCTIIDKKKNFFIFFNYLVMFFIGLQMLFFIINSFGMQKELEYQDLIIKIMNFSIIFIIFDFFKKIGKNKEKYNQKYFTINIDFRKNIIETECDMDEMDAEIGKDN